MPNEFVTIATFNFTTEPSFLLFKAALARHGIPYFSADENTVSVDPFLSIMVGGIRVQVHEEDVPEAVAIWREILQANEHPTAGFEEDFGDSDRILDDMRSPNFLAYQPLDEARSNRIYNLILIGLFLFIALVLILGVLKAQN